MQPDFERLITEAEGQPFSGWDFSYLKGRYVEGEPAWDFAKEVRKEARGAHSMLDLGTGGGEFLSSLTPLPEVCCTTEGYRPNSGVALERLGPMGVGVVFTFWDDNNVERQRGALPFRDGAFGLVVDRHESFLPSEVARVLTPGGVFLTQQVGSANNPELREFFGAGERPSVGQVPWNLSEAVGQIESAGMRVLEKMDAKMTSRFLDVGALVYYLKAIPSEVPGFSAITHRERLRDAHNLITAKGSFDVTTTRFYVRARKD